MPITLMSASVPIARAGRQNRLVRTPTSRKLPDAENRASLPSVRLDAMPSIYMMKVATRRSGPIAAVRSVRDDQVERNAVLGDELLGRHHDEGVEVQAQRLELLARLSLEAVVHPYCRRLHHKLVP